MQIREACQRDADDVAELLSELGYPSDGAMVLARLSRPDERVLVAKDDGSAIGLAALAVSHTLTHDAPVGRLTALVVSGTRRRCGVAHLLVATALELAEREGCEGVELTCGLRPERAAAHAFYQRLGFERTSYRYWRPVPQHDLGPDPRPNAGKGPTR